MILNGIKSREKGPWNARSLAYKGSVSYEIFV